MTLQTLPAASEAVGSATAPPIPTARCNFNGCTEELKRIWGDDETGWCIAHGDRYLGRPVEDILIALNYHRAPPQKRTRLMGKCPRCHGPLLERSVARGSVCLSCYRSLQREERKKTVKR